jgi:hypothetical protein
VNTNRSSASTRMRKSLIILCGVMFIVFFALEVFVDAYYHDYRPAEPQPAQGRVYATKLSKGAVVYLTRKEQVVYQVRMPLTLAPILIGLLLNTYWKQNASKKQVKS